MSVTITFTGETPEAIENQLDEWTKVLREGRRTVEAADKLNARVAEVQANVARAVKEEARRIETQVANVKAFKEMAAKADAFAVTRPLEVAFSNTPKTLETADPLGNAPAPDNTAPDNAVLGNTAPDNTALGVVDVPPYDEVMVAVLDVANAYSKDEALAMLSKFGAKRASDIDPSRWADVIAAAQALLKAA
ncbi:MAG: hypothetical protein WCP82_07575, partial [Alphaproteobacteria bacterium]